jgi:hypothetical protein
VGRWRAVTLPTPLKGGLLAPFYRGRLWVSLNFGQHVSDVFLRPLIRMRVIILARWTQLKDTQGKRYLLFETTWSGSNQSYIPDLISNMQFQATNIWGNTRRWPPAWSQTQVLEWVNAQDWGVDHMWSDYYDGASAQLVVESLELADSFERFVRSASGASAASLAERWRRFATANQHLL